MGGSWVAKNSLEGASEQQPHVHATRQGSSSPLTAAHRPRVVEPKREPLFLREICRELVAPLS